tara:strand:- start:938 stop:1189 length:252 start_codon:yes stop_codon:yes gene_type:complete
MDKWQQRKRPIRLERRFEFETYDKTRDFLDRLGDLSEKAKRFPDISFGKTYVNITIRPEEDLGDDQSHLEEDGFTNSIDRLLD